MKPPSKMKPWLQWIITNALGEMIGLGLTFAAGVGLFIGLEPKNFFQAVLLVFLMTATGIIEGPQAPRGFRRLHPHRVQGRPYRHLRQRQGAARYPAGDRGMAAGAQRLITTGAGYIF